MDPINQPPRSWRSLAGSLEHGAEGQGDHDSDASGQGERTTSSAGRRGASARRGLLLLDRERGDVRAVFTLVGRERRRC